MNAKFLLLISFHVFLYKTVFLIIVLFIFLHLLEHISIVYSWSEWPNFFLRYIYTLDFCLLIL
jgi:hypothetical protein